ncbi:hypothetical protein OB919_08240 [Halobacteria archaeon AArc-curdl1]|uniref:Uncharacterized protein n=1 Tax=Natronosalvus hydrolyticus TaxID=2979988 RepID=A0AAP2Z7H4_9EURY|nr:hypothetical protein [Halobacteria archaeon AArc-curdl1]
MSHAARPHVSVGCPACRATVSATVPSGTGIKQSDTDDTITKDDPFQLAGIEADCQECGHTVELYYYTEQDPIF